MIIQFSKLICFCFLVAIVISCESSEKPVVAKIEPKSLIMDGVLKAESYRGEQPVIFDWVKFGIPAGTLRIASILRSGYVERAGIREWKLKQRGRLNIYTACDFEVICRLSENEESPTSVISDICIGVLSVPGSDVGYYEMVEYLDDIYGDGIKYKSQPGVEMMFYFFNNIMARVYVPNEYDCVIEYYDIVNCLKPINFPFHRTMPLSAKELMMPKPTK